MLIRRRLLVALALLTAACATHTPSGLERPLPLPPFPADLAPLQRALAARVANEAGDYGIVVLDVQNGRRAGVNETMPMHAASTMKVPVLYELYRQASAGERAPDAPIEVRNRFRSIADTSVWYSLAADDDSERALYGKVGEQLPLRELVRRMIVRSSNLATNNLIELAGAERVRALMQRLGAEGMDVRRGVEDGPAYRAGLNNTTDALGFARVLASLARCELLTRELCANAIDILAQQEFNDMIPRGLPPGIRFAHKTGWITGIQHDGGIVYPQFGASPFVVVVLSRNAADTTAARRVAADVARLAWDALGSAGTLRPHWLTDLTEFLTLHERHRVPGLVERRLTHGELWGVLGPIAERGRLAVEELGRSAEGRPIRLIHAGEGALPVLLWSQMHGDETTASRALADLLNYMVNERESGRVRRWRERLHLLVLPMLNPDGAERHVRRNAYGIDVNRDARLLATPEGRILRGVQEKYRPQYGFNLHDQNPRTRVGDSDALASISLLAPPPDGSGHPAEQWQRAQRLIAWFGPRIEPLVAGHITRYDDSFNPRAFGDLMASWGVSTVLIESGGWAGDPVKRWLRAVNFAALAQALDAIASDAHATTDIGWYQALPENGRSVNDLLIRSGQIALAGQPPYSADLALDLSDAGYQLVDAGDLQGVAARDTLDATGLRIQPVDSIGSPASALLIGPAPRLLARGPQGDTVVWEVVAGRIIRRAK
jgi:beta-lactamase class A